MGKLGTSQGVEPMEMHGQTSEPINFSLRLFWSIPGASDGTAIQCAAQLSPILGFWSLEKSKYFVNCQVLTLLPASVSANPKIVIQIFTTFRELFL